MEKEKMKAKEFLKRHAASQYKIMALEAEIEQLYQSNIKSPANDGQPRETDIGDSTGSLAAKIADMREDIEWLWQQQQRIKWQVERTIYQLESPEQFRVCWLKYIELKDWTEIAEEMDKTARTVQRIHGNALLSVQEILDKLEFESE